MTTDERFKKLLDASPEQVVAIDEILEGRVRDPLPMTHGPLLMGMSASAKYLGVSRATLWRMIKDGRLTKVEVLPGSYRLRRADLEAIAEGRKLFGGSVDSDCHTLPQQPCVSTQRDLPRAA